MRFVLAITILAIAGGMISTDLSSDTRSINPAADSAADQSKPPIYAVKGEVLVTNRLDIDFSKYQVTFMELGADRCIPCKKMQPIMREIEQEYAGKVKVVFYDVWTPEGKPYGEKFGIRVIPTQVFLDKDGKEYFRHEGYFPKEELVKVLQQKGV